MDGDEQRGRHPRDCPGDGGPEAGTIGSEILFILSSELSDSGVRRRVCSGYGEESGDSFC